MAYLLNNNAGGSYPGTNTCSSGQTQQPYGYQPSQTSQTSYGYQPTTQATQTSYGYQPSQPSSYGYVPQQQQQQQSYVPHQQQTQSYTPSAPSYQPQSTYTPSAPPSYYQQPSYQQQQQQRPPAMVSSVTSSMTASTTKSPNEISIAVIGTRPSGAQTRVNLEVDPSDTTLGDITEMLADEIGIAPHMQLIKYKKKNMDSRTLTLKQLNFPDHSELAVSQKPPAQARVTPGGNNNNMMMTTSQQQSSQLPQGESYQSLRAEFDKIDVDRSGTIDEKELSRVFLGWAPRSLIRKAMAMADTNRDGKIDFDEYCAIRKQLGGVKVPKKGGKK
ncbi:Plastin-1 [Seminavis robusta]|uniref:Plastin-1 n=1 Tax=Seminavis robusta TaxID=568900 RepID=A0A9N8I1C6_9STRA|nr:Plastin-1 [Seminavis robusta]|eukprot:Sro3391_g347510.1 Plastin-1 (330) ;mRNA; f:2468-3457